jgi:Esterase/lipase
MGNFGLDIPWLLIEPEDPSGSDMVDISGVKRKWLDVAYDSRSPSQVLDIYLPEEGEGPFPTYIFIHGGAFIAGDKQDLQFLLAADGVNRGYAVVSVEYRKGFESKAPAGLYDVKAAVRFLKAHAGEYRLDPQRFALGGDSAGAYYAVFAAATAAIPAFDGPAPVCPAASGEVKAVVAQCGCYDLLRMAPPPEAEAAAPGEFVPGTIPANLMSIFIGANPRLFPDFAAWLNPLTYITGDFPPTLVQVGREDAVVPCAESELLAAVIGERCGRERVEFQIHEGWNHCALNHIVTKDWFMKANLDRVFGFLDRVL